MEIALVEVLAVGLTLALVLVLFLFLLRSQLRTRVRILSNGLTRRVTARDRERVPRADDRHGLGHRADDALAESLAPGVGTHLESPITVREVAVVDVSTGEESTAVLALVPIVRVPLGTTDAPGMELVFDYVADVLAAVHPVFDAADDPVSHYDVQFTFGPDGLLVSGECRRVGVPAELADRLVTDSSYRAHALRRDVESGSDGQDEKTVLWGECLEY